MPIQRATVPGSHGSQQDHGHVPAPASPSPKQTRPLPLYPGSTTSKLAVPWVHERPDPVKT